VAEVLVNRCKGCPKVGEGKTCKILEKVRTGVVNAGLEEGVFNCVRNPWEFVVVDKNSAQYGVGQEAKGL
jgi:hypothetical protein